MAYTGPGSDTSLLGGMDTVNSPALAVIPDTGEFEGWQSADSSVKARYGVFATYPAATPKYSTSNTEKSLETMARLLVPLTDKSEFVAFIDTFDGDAKTLARTLGAYEGGAEQAQSGSGGLGYIDFLLTSVQESYAEKVQIVDLLSDNYIAYFFGSQPPIFRCQGVLLNTLQDDWRAAFTILYNDIIRGTQLARRRKVVTLAYDNMAVSGAIINMNQVLTAEMQMASQLSFDLLVQRIDVTRDSRTPLPTQTTTFPATVHPSAFAEKLPGVPSVTIRETTTPGEETSSRQKADTSSEETIGAVSAETGDVYGTVTTLTQAALEAKRNVLAYWATFLLQHD